jgi:hypothetical protein
MVSIDGYGVYLVVETCLAGQIFLLVRGVFKKRRQIAGELGRRWAEPGFRSSDSRTG